MMTMMTMEKNMMILAQIATSTITTMSMMVGCFAGIDRALCPCR
jgi:hypothetical protein